MPKYRVECGYFVEFNFKVAASAVLEEAIANVGEINSQDLIDVFESQIRLQARRIVDTNLFIGGVTPFGTKLQKNGMSDVELDRVELDGIDLFGLDTLSSIEKHSVAFVVLRGFTSADIELSKKPNALALYEHAEQMAEKFIEKFASMVVVIGRLPKGWTYESPIHSELEVLDVYDYRTYWDNPKGYSGRPSRKLIPRPLTEKNFLID